MSSVPLTFPANSIGLQRGTVLRGSHPAVGQLGLEVGQEVPIGYDGEYVRCGPFTWSIDQLVQEVGGGIWEITGEVVNLADPKILNWFEIMVEGKKVAPLAAST
ncbi:MAG TPA: hypothetical protein VLA04_05315 [Verrucomicrobiae bacterium]|nr:hypothetical protein [Verrucomicrobiae bacterium]